MLFALMGLRPTENPLSQGEGSAKNGCFYVQKFAPYISSENGVCLYCEKEV